MPQTALSKRGSTYYLRLRVPVDLVSHYGRVEFKLSLKTRDRSIAIRQVRAELARLEREFSDLRERELRERTVQTLTRQRVTSLDEAMLDAIASSWLEQNLASDDLLRASGDAGELAESDEAMHALLRPAYANGDITPIEPAARQFVALLGLDLDVDEMTWHRLCLKLMETSLQAARVPSFPNARSVGIT